VIRTPRLSRAIERFLTDPDSIRTAIWLLTVVTVVAVFAGSLVMWAFDHREYPTFGRALWFTVQTVTTVGYGDVTPQHVVGRLVATLVMVVAIAFTTVVTAAVTSAFVQGARTRAGAREQGGYVEISERLDRIEQALSELAARPEGATAARERRET
jgi:voltage-gated potassium channel